MRTEFDQTDKTVIRLKKSGLPEILAQNSHMIPQNQRWHMHRNKWVILIDYLQSVKLQITEPAEPTEPIFFLSHIIDRNITKINIEISVDDFVSLTSLLQILCKNKQSK